METGGSGVRPLRPEWMGCRQECARAHTTPPPVVIRPPLGFSALTPPVHDSDNKYGRNAKWDRTRLVTSTPNLIRNFHAQTPL